MTYTVLLLCSAERDIADVAALHGCPVIDVGRHSGQSALNATTFTTDGLHHSTAGGTHYANFVGPRINQLVAV